MKTLVECYSGGEYAQRPKAFKWRGKRIAINAVIAEWQEPDGKGFRVMTEDMAIFDLFYDQDEDEWDVTRA